MSEHTSRKFGVIKIGITQGELSGIAPEITAKALKVFNKDRTIAIYVVASKDGKKKILSCVKTPLGKHITFIEPDKKHVPGNIGNSDALLCVYHAAKMALNKEIDAVVTAPVDKSKIAEKYSGFSGHTRFLEKILNVGPTLMFMKTPSLKIGIMTEHIPLKDVAKSITKQKIIQAVMLLNKHLSKFKTKPCIGVLSLNPHAGDSGLVGREEIKIISPAIKTLRKKGINVIGPLPADSAFSPSIKNKCDALLSMYHDQGMIPAKIKGMDSLVNITLGLPIIRTSPGHGVAYDIVGKNTASADSMIKAVNQAIEMVLAQRL
ncbi:MAG: 4-hydroxythreonine-4-phosphate dehydrogenase PdxA [Pseudomonadota bacterium]